MVPMLPETRDVAKLRNFCGLSYEIVFRHAHAIIDQFRALTVLDGLVRRIDGRVWGMRPNSISHAFERICPAAGVEGLTFHDLRHEATSRLFEKGLNPMEVTAVTGHKTLQMLKRYPHLRAEDLVALIG